MSPGGTLCVVPLVYVLSQALTTEVEMGWVVI